MKTQGKIEAEKCLLGSILLDPECLWTIRTIIKSENYFSSYRNRIIFLEMVEAADAENGIIDYVLLQESLIQKDLIKKVGGLDYLSEILDSVVTSKHAEAYAKELRDQYIRRVSLELSDDLKDESQTEPIEDLLSTIDSARDHMVGAMELEGDKNIKGTVIDILKSASSGESPKRLSSGYKNIDNLIIGYDPGDLILLAGRPSMGKTTLAMNMISKLCSLGKRILFFSLEMTKRDILINMISHVARINSHFIRKQNLPDNLSSKVVIAGNEIANYPLDIIDNRGHTLSTIRSTAKTAHNKAPLDLIVVDHLSKVCMRKYESETQRISKISNQLRQIAGELGVPVLCLNQLNRDLERREDKRPRLSDLRQSGELEQDADIVMFVYRPYYYNRDDHSLKDQSEIIIAKARKAETGYVKLHVDLNISTFFDYAPPHADRI